MKKRTVLTIAAFGVAALGFAALSVTPSSAVTSGSKAPMFTLKDVSGKDHSLKQYLSSQYVVLMFIATQCPISNDYNERMVKLYDTYASKEIAFIGINSNRQESVDEVREHAKDNRFKFVVLKDFDNLVADEYGAQVTPEIYVIDAEAVVRYHGRIDDSRKGDDISSPDLENALNALLAGNDPPKATTKAFGCTIKRVKKGS